MLQFYDAIDLDDGIWIYYRSLLRLIKLGSMLAVIFSSGSDCFDDYIHLFCFCKMAMSCQC